ncbi:MAG: CRISPR-associated helicase Cas3' [Allobaculum sp.]|uniref:CRISPR-associated helicase Cas3' n=1 Tax=Allobaculum sp. TaxID=1872463 RepID=UPI00399BE82D
MKKYRVDLLAEAEMKRIFEELPALKEACSDALGKGKGEHFLPLWMHLADTAAVMYWLITYALPEGLMKVLVREGTGNTEDEKRRSIRKTALFLALVHDLGKESALFQRKILENCEIGKQEHLYCCCGRSSSNNHSRAEQTEAAHHALCGAIQLAKMEFDSPEGKLKIPKGIASIVAAHHGKILSERLYDSVDLRRDYRRAVFDGDPKKWTERMQKICKTALRATGCLHEKGLPYLTEPSLMILSGLLVEADWLASDERYFSLIDDRKEDRVEVYPERWEKGISSIGFLDSPQFQETELDDAGFETMFSLTPNPMQHEVLSIVSAIKEPGIAILETPTGSGKTETALAMAAVMCAKTERNGIYFALPSQASANGLFDRFARWAGRQTGTGEGSLRLAHGKASFNKDYQSYKMKLVNGNVDSDGTEESHLLVRDWTERPKTSLLADFVIGTVDQGLKSVLDICHVMLRHLGLAEKAVIVDEVHAYDVYMQSSLYRMLEWMGIYQVPVILLSATLPPGYKETLIRSYMKGRSSMLDTSIDDQPLAAYESTAYPSLIWSDGSTIYSNSLSDSGQSRTIYLEQIRYDSKMDEFEKTAERVCNALLEGGCCAVIFNSVRKAQNFGRVLEDNCPDLKIIVIHSRFTDADRAKIEEETVHQCGKQSTAKDRDRTVVIGTQVIEQSLDLDFDFLISEIAPIDLLLQRAGRLHRHVRRSRPVLLKIPRMSILIPDSALQTVNYESVYADWLLLRTEMQLPEVLHIPADIPSLLRNVYSEQTAEAEGELAGLKKIEFEADQAKERNKASAVQLKMPTFGEREKCSLGQLSKCGTLRDASARDIEQNVTACVLAHLCEDFYQPCTSSSLCLSASAKIDEPMSEGLRGGFIQIPLNLWEACKQHDGHVEEEFQVWRADPLWKKTKFLVIDQDSFFDYDCKYGLSIRNSIRK